MRFFVAIPTPDNYHHLLILLFLRWNKKNEPTTNPYGSFGFLWSSSSAASASNSTWAPCCCGTSAAPDEVKGGIDGGSTCQIPTKLLKFQKRKLKLFQKNMSKFKNPQSNEFFKEISSVEVTSADETWHNGGIISKWRWIRSFWYQVTVVTWVFLQTEMFKKSFWGIWANIGPMYQKW